MSSIALLSSGGRGRLYAGCPCNAGELDFTIDGRRYSVEVMESVSVSGLGNLPGIGSGSGFNWGGLIASAINVGGGIYLSTHQGGASAGNSSIPEADRVALQVYDAIDSRIPLIQAAQIAPDVGITQARAAGQVWFSYHAQTHDGRRDYLNQIDGAVRIKIGLVERAAAEFIAAHAAGAAGPSSVASPGSLPVISSPVVSIPSASATSAGIDTRWLLYGGAALFFVFLLTR